MRCKQFICAQNIIVDFQSKRISAINLLEDFSSAIFPVPLQFSVYTCLEKNEDEPINPDITLHIKQNEKILATAKILISFVIPSLPAKNISVFSALFIPSTGPLVFDLIYNDESFFSYTLNIQAATSDQGIAQEPVLITP